MSASRIACFISEGPGEVYFANRLHEAFGVDLAIVARARPKNQVLVGKYRTGGQRAVSAAVRERIDERRRRKVNEADCDRWLGDRWHRLDPTVPVLRTASINGSDVVERLSALGTVDLVVHANSIVREGVLRVCRTALNLHWGLSPYYRGTRCTEWALLHWDCCNIGVTVHELAAEIDGGKIVGQARAELLPEDTVHSINVQLTALGTELMIESLQVLRNGGELERTPQDLTRGHLYYKRQWSGRLSGHVASLERQGLGRMLASPSRGELPIVRLRGRATGNDAS